ncbi:MAG TPA: rod shape-determining protein MreD [Steroidobacteraceae bacterium]|nr:rod shape-determining protein MreD [Steroidobacteraceae bacterium]
MNRERDPLLAIWLTSLSGLVLSIVPLNYWLGLFRPQFAALVVLYWSIMSPRSGGILLGFVCGLMLDVFSGTLLGEHALALSLMAYLGIRLNLLLRAKPLFQQSLFVFAALVIYELVLWAVEGWSGHGLSTPLRWLATLSGTLLWPILVGVLGRMHTEH